MDPSTQKAPNQQNPSPTSPGGAVESVAYPRTGVEPTAPIVGQPVTGQPVPGQPIPPTAVPVGTKAPLNTPPVNSTRQLPANPAAAQPAPAARGATPGPTPTVGADKAAAKSQTHSNSTQNSLQIVEVRDGIAIMNDGSFRSVLMVKSINFDLMSTREQEGVEYSYQGFLNSLYFPIQIFMRSQKVDLAPYITKLDKIRMEHDNMLLALLMEDYIGYIDELSQQTNIMDKKFYVVIPFFPAVNAQKALTQSKNFLGGVGGLFRKKEQHVVINEPDLENAKTELRNRVQAVLSGLQQCSIQGLPLDTQELIELYYDTYNPDTATRQRLKDFGDLTADVVTKGEGAAPQAHLQGEMD